MSSAKIGLWVMCQFKSPQTPYHFSMQRNTHRHIAFEWIQYEKIEILKKDIRDVWNTHYAFLALLSVSRYHFCAARDEIHMFAEPDKTIQKLEHVLHGL